MTTSRLPLLFINVAHAYDHFFMLIFPTAVLVVHKEWGAAYGETLVLGTAAFVVFAAGTLPAGWLGDRWSRRHMMSIFFIGLGCASILAGLARDPVELAVALGLIGLFASIYHPVATAMIVHYADRMGRALGVNGVFGNMGVAFAALITGALAGYLGWRAAFVLPGVVALATGVAFALFISPRFRDPGPAKEAGGHETVDRAGRVRVLAFIAIAAVLGGLVFNGVTVSLPKVFEEALGQRVTGVAGVGVFVSAVFAVAGFVQIAVGYLLDRYGAKHVLLVVLVVQVPVLTLMGPVSGFAVVLVALPLMLAVFGQIPIIDWMVGQAASPEWRSRLYAVKYVLSLGVSALAVPMVAVLHGSTGGFEVFFLVLSASVAVLLAAALVLLPGRASPSAPAPAGAST